MGVEMGFVIIFIAVFGCYVSRRSTSKKRVKLFGPVW